MLMLSLGLQCQLTDSNSSVDTEDTFGIIGAINAEDCVHQVDLSSLQLQDSDLVGIITYLKTGELPEDSRRTRELVTVHPSR